MASGNPTQFAGLISSNTLQVGGLLVSNTWVSGDIMDLSMNRTNGALFLTVFCRPQKIYLLLASTNFLDWTPVLTNWLFLDTNAPAHPRRFYRAWGQGK